MDKYNISNLFDFKKLINSPVSMLGLAAAFVFLNTKMSPIELVQNYAKSFLGIGSKFPMRNISASSQLVIGAVFAGYTSTAFPPEFLKLFEHPVAQFFIFFLLFNSMEHVKGFPTIFVIVDAVLFTILIQVVLRLVREFYKKPEQKKE